MEAFFTQLGEGILFLHQLKRKIYPMRRLAFIREEIFKQIWKITLHSYTTTAVAGFFVGSIMTVQFTLQISEFGALSYLGGLATSATVREIGPLLIAFMLAGKIGAFTTAELGTMKVTEQIDAIRCLGADPHLEVVLPRFIGIIISSFFLLCLGLITSLLGGMVLGKFFSGVSPEEYIRYIATIVTWNSILLGLIKCLVFAFAIASICTFVGFTTTGGARGVGRSVVKSAIYCMVLIVISDWMISFIFESLTNAMLGGK